MNNTVTIGEAKAGGGLDFISLFLHADPVVQVIMIGLALASIISWAIMLEKSFSIWWQRRADISVLAAFKARGTASAGKSHAATLQQALDAEIVATEGWNDGTRERFFARARLLLGDIKRKREAGLSFLATVASAGPFIGLFGTVWGIMNSFAAIAESKNTSLDVVAPGIAEALLATAIGLFAAIPAAIFYNRLTSQVSKSLVPAETLVQEMLIAHARGKSPQL